MEAENTRIKVTVIWFSVRALWQTVAYLLYFYMVGREIITPVSLLIKAPIPPKELHPHDLITSQRLPLQIPSHWRLGLQYVNLRAHKHLVYSKRSVEIYLDLLPGSAFQLPYLIWLFLQISLGIRGPPPPSSPLKL